MGYIYIRCVLGDFEQVPRRFTGRMQKGRAGCSRTEYNQVNSKPFYSTHERA